MRKMEGSSLMWLLCPAPIVTPPHRTQARVHVVNGVWQPPPLPVHPPPLTPPLQASSSGWAWRGCSSTARGLVCWTSAPTPPLWMWRSISTSTRVGRAGRGGVGQGGVGGVEVAGQLAGMHVGSRGGEQHWGGVHGAPQGRTPQSPPASLWSCCSQAAGSSKLSCALWLPPRPAAASLGITLVTITQRTALVKYHAQVLQPYAWYCLVPHPV